MFNWINKHRKTITIILIVMMIAIVAIPFLLLSKYPVFSDDSSRLEIVENILQIVSAVFVVVGAFIAVSQYYLSSKSEIIRIETDKIERAIKLADFYKNEILEPYSIIRDVYEKAGIFGSLQKERNKMKNFDEDELREIFTDKEIKNLEKMYLSKEFFEAMGSANEFFNTHIDGFQTSESIVKKGQTVKTISVDVTKALCSFSKNYTTRLLNNMEEFAMYFTHNIADESVVYQSLYPTYIEMCRALYLDISKCSKAGYPKLYRNVQELYIIWLNKSSQAKRNIEEHQNSRGTVPDNIR